MKKLYRGPYIDAFCQAWFHLAQLFQRRRFYFNFIPPFSIFSFVAILDGCRDHRTQFWEPSLAESIYIRSSIKFLHFVPFRKQIWPPRAIFVSDWLMLEKSSPLKLLGQMEPNLVGSIYVRSSIKLLHLVPFGQQTWPLLLRIEHMVKLHVFGNNSKTINNIRNLTG
jgi:hypothetical protein